MCCLPIVIFWAAVAQKVSSGATHPEQQSTTLTTAVVRQSGYYLLHRVTALVRLVHSNNTRKWVDVNSSGSDPTSLIQFGVLGVIIMLILFGFLWAKPSVDQLKADKSKAEADRDALVDLYQTQIIPVLAEVNRAVIPAIAQIQQDLHEIREQLG